MGGLSLSGLAESVLHNRTPTYVTSLIDKLGGEGIVERADLLGTSVGALEMKLSTHAAFNHGEVSDVLRLRRAVDGGMGSDAALIRGQGALPRDNNRQRSRSGGRRFCGSGVRSDGWRDWGWRRGYSSGGGRGSVHGVPKPRLWQAVEDGDEVCVRRLLAEGAVDVEEKFRGWSPLMKAAEEGHVGIAKLLLEKRADLSVTNHKGRDALSFAAAPSMKGKVRRPTAIGVLELLLECGADASVQDADGLSAQERAMRERRGDALEVFAAFGR